MTMSNATGNSLFYDAAKNECDHRHDVKRTKILLKSRCHALRSGLSLNVLLEALLCVM